MFGLAWTLVSDKVMVDVLEENAARTQTNDYQVRPGRMESLGIGTSNVKGPHKAREHGEH